MRNFKFLTKSLPFEWVHYGEFDESFTYHKGITWNEFLEFAESKKDKGIGVFVRTIEINDDGSVEEYGLDIFECGPEKFLKIIQDDDVLTVVYLLLPRKTYERV